MVVCCVACTPDVEPQWHMSSRLNYDGQPVNWKSGSVIGCQLCKILEANIAIDPLFSATIKDNVEFGSNAKKQRTKLLNV